MENTPAESSAPAQDIVFHDVAGKKKKKSRGAALVEYALLVALIAIVAILAIRTLGTKVSTQFSTVARQV